MCQAVLSPNLTKKFQWEVSQIADNRFPLVMLLGFKLKPPKNRTCFLTVHGMPHPPQKMVPSYSLVTCPP